MQEPAFFCIEQFFWKKEYFSQFRSPKLAKINFENVQLQADKCILFQSQSCFCKQLIWFHQKSPFQSLLEPRRRKKTGFMEGLSNKPSSV